MLVSTPEGFTDNIKQSYLIWMHLFDKRIHDVFISVLWTLAIITACYIRWLEHTYLHWLMMRQPHKSWETARPCFLLGGWTKSQKIPSSPSAHPGTFPALWLVSACDVTVITKSRAPHTVSWQWWMILFKILNWFYLF